MGCGVVLRPSFSRSSRKCRVRSTCVRRVIFSNSHWCSKMSESPLGLHPCRFSSPRTYVDDVSRTLLCRRCRPGGKTHPQSAPPQPQKGLGLSEVRGYLGFVWTWQLSAQQVTYEESWSWAQRMEYVTTLKETDAGQETNLGVKETCPFIAAPKNKFSKSSTNSLICLVSEIILKCGYLSCPSCLGSPLRVLA